MPNSGPMKMAARFSVPDAVPSTYRPSAQTRSPGQGVMRRESDLVFLVRLLHAGGLEVFQDHLDEALLVIRPLISTPSISSSFSSTASTRCGERLSTVNGPATRTFLLSS